jgi:hypothetical protein
LLDDLPGLVFKAYLHAVEPEQTYAPFYLWRDAEAMHGFLNGPAFAGVARAFGWPSVKTWTPWHAHCWSEVRQAMRRARGDCAVWRVVGTASSGRSIRAAGVGAGALAVVIGFEPVTWTITRLCLWREAPPPVEGERRYDVGHLSAPHGGGGDWLGGGAVTAGAAGGGRRAAGGGRRAARRRLA